jgi:glycosylphosphatidylinositol transamidase (GPIT) subunit GPI8
MQLKQKEFQHKMDEFKEEYAKKLSLQNDQLEELKKAFLGFQEKVDNSKKKLNGFELELEAHEGQQDQQKMPTKSLPSSTKSEQQVC